MTKIIILNFDGNPIGIFDAVANSYGFQPGDTIRSERLFWEILADSARYGITHCQVARALQSKKIPFQKAMRRARQIIGSLSASIRGQKDYRITRRELYHIYRSCRRGDFVGFRNRFVNSRAETIWDRR